MRDYDYCKIMLEAYRDVLSLVIKGLSREQLNQYLLEQISFHEDWKNESQS